MTIFTETESSVRSYCRSFPVVFHKAQGSHLYDNEGKQYLDFLAGAGTLNYGHNNPILKEALLAYIQEDGITHGLDMHTEAKKGFLESLQHLILDPRGLGDYVAQFTGPTGTNAVEAAMKIARKVTGRSHIIAFSNGFHGCTLGAVAATANRYYREGAGIALSGVSHVPFDGYLGKDVDTTKYLDKILTDGSGGNDFPAAVLVETVQGEGGLNVASADWLRNLEKVCRKHGVLLIVDDNQAGCGRTRRFFSFEEVGIQPDIITLSKSLSGYGLPFALTLFRKELDIWKPGEHNGTFRGNNHAFTTAKKALETYWKDDSFAAEVRAKGDMIGQALKRIAGKHAAGLLRPKGRGMMRGLECKSGDLAGAITAQCFERGLVIETSGADGQVVKILAPLTTSEADLKRGLAIIEESIADVLEGGNVQAAS